LIRNPCRSYFDPGFNLSKSPCSGTRSNPMKKSDPRLASP
jgi:hypothetical protein